MGYLLHRLTSLLALAAQNLGDTLFGDAEDLGQGDYRLPLLMSRADLRVAVTFLWRAIRNWRCG